jgi:hypothetical protein
MTVLVRSILEYQGLSLIRPIQMDELIRGSASGLPAPGVPEPNRDDSEDNGRREVKANRAVDG